jgi:hypothetical protein
MNPLIVSLRKSGPPARPIINGRDLASHEHQSEVIGFCIEFRSMYAASDFSPDRASSTG